MGISHNGIIDVVGGFLTNDFFLSWVMAS